MSLINYNSLLNIFICNLIPETKLSVSKGNKIFGAFILKKLDSSLVVTGTNNETVNPLYHGEISAILNFFKLKNLNPKDFFFISSHEPCSLCLSAITWSGFDNFYYFFPHQETKKDFNIPHDLNILKEVFNIKNGKYNKNNEYWQSHSIIKKINHLENEKKDKLLTKIKLIKEFYVNQSFKYQVNKLSNNIPLN